MTLPVVAPMPTFAPGLAELTQLKSPGREQLRRGKGYRLLREGAARLRPALCEDAIAREANLIQQLMSAAEAPMEQNLAAAEERLDVIKARIEHQLSDPAQAQATRQTYHERHASHRRNWCGMALQEPVPGQDVAALPRSTKVLRYKLVQSPVHGASSFFMPQSSREEPAPPRYLQRDSEAVLGCKSAVAPPPVQAGAVAGVSEDAPPPAQAAARSPVRNDRCHLRARVSVPAKSLDAVPTGHRTAAASISGRPERASLPNLSLERLRRPVDARAAPAPEKRGPPTTVPRLKDSELRAVPTREIVQLVQALASDAFMTKHALVGSPKELSKRNKENIISIYNLLFDTSNFRANPLAGRQRRAHAAANTETRPAAAATDAHKDKDAPLSRTRKAQQHAQLVKEDAVLIDSNRQQQTSTDSNIMIHSPLLAPWEWLQHSPSLASTVNQWGGTTKAAAQTERALAGAVQASHANPSLGPGGMRRMPQGTRAELHLAEQQRACARLRKLEREGGRERDFIRKLEREREREREREAKLERQAGRRADLLTKFLKDVCAASPLPRPGSQTVR